ncbi:GDSL-type esterase/lipase family protein [Aquimarina sp. AU119]|uniref:SGNH/GDSL hydrolase family protein n=1 Tax=Aquimarina sp. AU119 TaxID=2108528 RepID=UPI000D68C80E|nr:GDSL-type esterase/lipase family protein [Aquimarina sp. AU119]
MSNNTVKAIIIGLGILITSCGKKEDPIVKNNTIIACIGDSVTYGGEHGYVEYLQKYMNDSVPEKKVTLLNWGKNSETITHLTETGHPGPRPFLFDRLDSLLTLSPKPDIVTFCYGMNCGIYGLPSEELFMTYNNRLILFLDTMKGQEIDVILMTPPPLALDAANTHGRIASSEEDVYSWKNPYERYDEEVIQKFKDIILETNHPAVIKKIDIHTPLLQQADKAYDKDPIHPNANGYRIIADTIFKFLL